MKMCLKLRQEWDDKWFPGRHEKPINDLKRGIKKLEKRLKNSWDCHQPTPAQCR